VSAGWKNPRAWKQRDQVAADTEELHGATSQKTAFFVVIAVKTSNFPLQIMCTLLNNVIKVSGPTGIWVLCLNRGTDLKKNICGQGLTLRFLNLYIFTSV
jgi:hypothetical protein